MIKHRLGKRFPNLVAHVLARKFPGRFFHFAPKLIISLWTAGKADHAHSRWQFAVSREIIKCRHQLAMG